MRTFADIDPALEDDASAVSGRGATPGVRMRRLVQIERVVEAILTSPSAKVLGLPGQLGVSQATFYRILKEPEFHRLLEEGVNAHFAARVGQALDKLTAIMDDAETPVQTQVSLAKWLLDRHERLVRLLAEWAKPPEGEDDEGERLTGELRAELEGTALDASRVDSPVPARGD